MYADFVVKSRQSLLCWLSYGAEQRRDERFLSPPTPLRQSESPFQCVLGTVPQEINRPGRNAGFSPPPSSEFLNSPYSCTSTHPNALTLWSWNTSEETFMFTFDICCTSNKVNKTQWGQKGSVMTVGKSYFSTLRYQATCLLKQMCVSSPNEPLGTFESAKGPID